MVSFFETMMGQKFYDHDVPQIQSTLSEIATELKRANDLKELELGPDVGTSPNLVYVDRFDVKAFKEGEKVVACKYRKEDSDEAITICDEEKISNVDNIHMKIVKKY